MFANKLIIHTLLLWFISCALVYEEFTNSHTVHAESSLLLTQCKDNLHYVSRISHPDTHLFALN